MLSGYNDLMDNLAQLISMLKEAKEELTKSNSTEELEKYASPFTMFGSSRKAAPVAAPAKPAKLTGSDKIAAVSKQPIQSMVSDDKQRAATGAPAPIKPKLTGLDRIKAESQRPIESMTSKIKKDEDEEKVKKSMAGDMKGGGNSLTHPANMERANTFHAAMNGAFQPKAAPAGPMMPKAGPAAPAKKLTGMDRIKAMSQQPITKADLLKQSCSDKPFSKTVNGSYGAGANESDMAMSEKLSLDKGGQWSLKKKVRDPEVGSPAAMENGSTVEGAGKSMNGRVGDPRHLNRDKVFHSDGTTRKGAKRDVVTDGNNWTSGVSSLRPEKHSEYNRDTAIERSTQKPVKWHKSVDDEVSLNKGGQWSLDKAEDEKGRCTNCFSRSCDGEDCKVDHVKNSVKANNKQNEGFTNKIKGLCPKCHAKKCQCAKDGVLVDKMEKSATTMKAEDEGFKKSVDDDGYNTGITGHVVHVGTTKLKDGSTNYDYDHLDAPKSKGGKPYTGGSVTVDKHNVITDVGHATTGASPTHNPFGNALLRAHKAKFPHHIDPHDKNAVKN